MADGTQDAPSATETPERPEVGSRDDRTSETPTETPTGDRSIAGHCPSCGRETLTRANGGHVTCTRLECPEPTAADDLLHDLPTDGMATQLYKAQDALEFARECLAIAEREGSPITVERVRAWLDGAKCGRHLIAEGVLKIEGDARA